MSEPFELRLAGRVAMAARATGPEDGRRVLGLHGWLDNAATLARLAPVLPGARIVSLDLPGHGRSDMLPPGVGYHFLDHLQDIRDAARDLGWERFHLLGHSMGGALSLAYAAAFPEQVASVVSIDALGPMSDQAEHTAGRLREALESREEQIPPGRRFASFDEAVRARRRDGHLAEESARVLAERGVVRESGGWRWSADRRHRWPSIHRLSEAQVLAVLGAVRAPVLLLRGADSQFRLPDAVAAGRLAALAEVRALELPGRHHLHLDDPEPCGRAIAAFWQDLDRAPAQAGSSSSSTATR